MSRAAKCSAEDFVALYNTFGPTETALRLNCSERAVYRRKSKLSKTHQLILPQHSRKPWPGRTSLELLNGTVLVGSDFHIWPGDPSTCLRAFKKFITDLKPDVIVLNGDVMDFPRISKHPQRNWETAPEPAQEIEAVQDHLSDIVNRAKRGSKKIWTWGNHDDRFESMVANTLPLYRGIKGVRLHDHFAIWERAMSLFINEETEGATMVLHRMSGGVHATYNNVKKGFVNVITGHLHQQNVRPLSTYRSVDFYGVDTGCVADKHHKAFSYTLGSALDWREGFALLTYKDGRLMYPELISKWGDDYVQFRGRLIRV